MSDKWQYREEGKQISQSVIAQKSTDDLLKAKDFIKGLLDLRKSEKLMRTYIKGTKDAIEYNQKDKVYVDYRFDGTATGRLSCAAYSAKKSMGVSFHTLPRDTDDNIRSLFIAPDNWNFITVDYSGMELRILAHIAKERNMQKALLSGEDLHSYTAKLLFDKDTISKEERQIAKTVSFLIVYGGGAFNLSETMGIPIRRAEKVISNYQRVYPGIFSYMEYINEFIKENGYAYTIFGRRRNLPDVYSRDRSVVNRALRQGVNFTIQSAASDTLLCSLLGITDQFTSKGMQSRVVATVHDSVEIVSPPEETQEACEIIYDEMVNYSFIRTVFDMEFDVPLAIDMEVGRSFGGGKEVHIQK